MTTQEYLGQVILFERKIRNKMVNIEHYKDMATSITVANNPNKVQSSGDKDKMGTVIAKMADLEKEVSSLISQRETIIDQIESINNPDWYQILFSKYVEDINLFTIRETIHCSKTQVYRLHEEALTEFERKFGSKYLRKNIKRAKREK